MSRPKIIAAAIAALLVLIVVLQNMEPVNTKILFFEREIPRALLLLITFGLGVVAGLLTAFGIITGRKKEKPA